MTALTLFHEWADACWIPHWIQCAHALQVDWTNISSDELAMWQEHWEGVAFWADCVCGIVFFFVWVAGLCVIVVPNAYNGMDTFILMTPWPASHNTPSTLFDTIDTSTVSNSDLLHSRPI